MTDLKSNSKFLKNHKLLDAGCGNGRLADFLKEEPIKYVGLDNNKELLKIAKKKHPKLTFCHGDILKLPFPKASFDSVWCIAVLHHLPTKSLQLKALKEMKRVLKKNGMLMLTVWDLWQKKYKKYIDKKTHHSFIPWGPEKEIKRFYYAFTKAELKKLISKAGLTSSSLNSTPYNLVFTCHEKS